MRMKDRVQKGGEKDYVLTIRQHDVTIAGETGGSRKGECGEWIDRREDVGIAEAAGGRGLIRIELKVCGGGRD